MADSETVAPVEKSERPAESTTAAYADALHELLAGTHLAAPDELPDVLLRAAARMGITDAAIYLVDYEQQALVPFTGHDTKPREVQSVDGSVAGRAFQRVEPVDVAAASDERRVWLPLLDGVERLGVLEVVIPGSAPLTQDGIARLGQLAHLVTELVVSNSHYTDSFEWVRRRSPMTLPAEMQHALLPPLTFGTSRIVISGLLAPAYEVGGDAFDYALNGNIAHVAVFDAIGHGLHASLLANLAVACYRNSRRAGLPLDKCVEAIDAALADGFGVERYVTAVVAQLDIDTGIFRWINAGHPAPMLLRDGQLVKELHCDPALPLGMGSLTGSVAYEVCEEALQPGDRLLLVTDGVDEARTEDGTFFGRDRLAEFAARELASGLPTPEVMRRLQTAILRHQTGQLQDDATTLFVEWLTGSPAELTL